MISPAYQSLQSYVSSLAYADLDARTVQNSKLILLDTLGAMLAAPRTQEVRAAVKTLEVLGSAGPCTLFGHVERMSVTDAAFVNAVAAHVLELDDTHRTGMLHLAAPIVPAALATAEYADRSGRELIAAIVGGFEVAARIAQAVQPDHWRRGFLAMGTCGVFGAAAAVAMLLRLDHAGVSDAMGLAGMFASGINTSIFGAGDMAKTVVPANAARAGALAAFLAAHGYTGSAGVLEQPKGFCRAYSDQPQLERLTEGLGMDFQINWTGLKPYACCRFYHAPIDAVLAIMKQGGISADEIDGMSVRTYALVANDRPHRAAPNNVFDAKMSLRFCLSLAAYLGVPTVREFSEERIKDPRIVALARRVRIDADDGMTASYPESSPAEVTVTTKSGQRYSVLIQNPKGDPEAPMTSEEIVAKFKSLASMSMTPDLVDAVVGLVNTLDQLPTVRSLTEQCGNRCPN